MAKVCCFSFFFILFITLSNNYSSGGKIVGGYDASIENVPYQAFLQVSRGFRYYRCGGSIISPKVVLTAAHCLVRVRRVYIRIGSRFANGGGRVYNTSMYIKHPRYNATSYDYDVGVVMLRRAMELDEITSQVISLPEQRTEVLTGTKLLVSGWGRTSEDGTVSNVLKAVEVPTVSTENCRKVYGQNAITNRKICAGPRDGGSDSCQGDSGGPAVEIKTGKQIGIVSYGIGCARPGIPGIYTKVSSVRVWIRRIANV